MQWCCAKHFIVDSDRFMSFLRQIIRDRRARAQSIALERHRCKYVARHSFLNDKVVKPWPRPYRLDPRLLSMSTPQISRSIQQKTAASCSACGITIYAVPATIPDLLSQPSIGFWTKRVRQCTTLARQCNQFVLERSRQQRRWSYSSA